MNARYETPDALRHDAHVLAEDMHALINATSQMADEKIAKSRERLSAALAAGRDLATEAQLRAVEGAHVADACVRRHPYQSMLISFGLGTVVGCLVGRRP